MATRTEALAQCLFATLTALVCAGLVSAAVLVPVPVGVLPMIVTVCVGFPMLAAADLGGAIAVLRAPRGFERLRAQISALPEVAHPLDR